MAIDRKSRRPRQDHPLLRVVRFPERALVEGVVEHRIEGVRVRITSPARTVVDCFRYRSKVGLDVAIEALRDYRRAATGTVDELWKAAEVARVRSVIQAPPGGPRVTASPNVAASVEQRLLNLAKKRGVEFNRQLTWYGIERLLCRLSRTSHERRFVLKGAMLFHIWHDEPHRPTRDAGLLRTGASDEAALAKIFVEICAANVEDDGVDFAADSVRTEPIREGNSCVGVRIKLMGRIGVARSPLQVDVGFGDAVVPAPQTVELPALLGRAPPRLSAYRRETVVAEKLHAIVDLGLTNTRMKDYFDLGFLSANFAFDGVTLAGSIAATFERRSTVIPDVLPTGLTEGFANDLTRRARWRGFLHRAGLQADEIGLGKAGSVIGEFLGPPLAMARSRDLVKVCLGRQTGHGGPFRSLRSRATISHGGCGGAVRVNGAGASGSRGVGRASAPRGSSKADPLRRVASHRASPPAPRERWRRH